MKDWQLHVGLVGPAPPPNGGMSLQTQELLRLLRQEGLDVEMLATNSPYKPAWVERFTGVRALFRLLPYLARVWRLAGRVDVIHMMANSGWSWQLFSAPVVWASWLRRTPVIINYRGGEAPAYFKRSFSRVKPTLLKASVVVVPSGFLQKVFKDYGISTTIVPNIINLDRFKPCADIKQTDQFVLAVARNLEAIYGIETAIKAVGLVRELIPHVQLIVAGSGPQQRELQDLVASLGLQDTVSFVGRLEPDDMVSLYQSAQIVLNPATVDNMPNSVLEAQACGVPVISTDVGGVPYIVEHEVSALLVPAGEEQNMAAAIERLYRDSDLRKTLAETGLHQVRQYAWTEVKEQWLNIYHKSTQGCLL